MSKISDVFFNFFWSNSACRNLFLLSKSELLDKKKISLSEKTISVSYPRIILSNVFEDPYEKQKIQLRTDNKNIHAEATIQAQIEKYVPVVTNYVENKFGKALEKFTKDIEKRPLKILGKLLFQLLKEDKNSIEKTVIKILQSYGFIGHHLKTFNDVSSFFQKETIDKNLRSIVNEDTLWNMHEFLSAIKDIYINSNFQSIYNSNQILTSALYSEDNFQSRLQLFDLLYDASIVASSREESFIECNNCEPGQFKGVIQMKIRPKNLNKLVCPTCNTPLTYYVTYELHNEIYEIVKSPDGLILNALQDLLIKHEIKFKINLIDKRLNTEFDCVFKYKGQSYAIETKMYETGDGDRRKLSNKVTEHFYKFSEKIASVIKFNPDAKIESILLVNIQDKAFLDEIKIKCPSNIEPHVEIMNIDRMKDFINKLVNESDIINPI